MDESAVEATAEKLRAGEAALTTLATPLNSMILRALAERPMRLAELRRETGLPAQTTLRGHLANLREMGALSKRPTDQMPHATENSLTPMGHELLAVAGTLNCWLGQAPGGPVALETGAGRGVVKAFADGWGSTIIRSLASMPMSLTELDRNIPDLSYPALERRLSSMRIAGLIEARESRGGVIPYAVTDWTRRGVAPLVAASKCERGHMDARAAPVTQADIEAAFLLATPLVGLPAGTNGTCQLEVEADPVEARAQARISVTVEQGRVVACDSGLGPSPGNFAAGSVTKWFSAVRDGTASLLRFGGDRRVAEGIVLGLHAAMVTQ
ncbi:MAG TPA: winged helix-turn-helix transcriptional regulator [Solirubrobacterales bacterium]|nr:winged helix-turn-helix transcriptional regulator [Solirubrobacterales bacterium]